MSRARFTFAAVVALLAGCAHAPPPPDASLLVRAPPGAQLFIDDAYAGLAQSAPLPLYSGFHRVEIRAEGLLPAYREITLAPGEHGALTAELHPDLDAPREAPTHAHNSGE